MKKNIKPLIKKSVVAQDNRFIYAKYNFDANELKIFLWMVAKINPEKDERFEPSRIPVSEIFQIYNHKFDNNHTYVKKLIEKMIHKTYIEDLRILDKKTTKEVNVIRAFTFFKRLTYQIGDGFIEYEFNEKLIPYFLNLKQRFTQIKYQAIWNMNSVYGMRIYNILMCEINQNKKRFKMNLAVLQNILSIDNSLKTWQNFRKKVIDPAIRNINKNEDSLISISKLRTSKTGKKITEIEFIFDYKKSEYLKQKEDEKKRNYNVRLAGELDKLLGCKIFIDKRGEYIIENYNLDKDNNIYAFCKNNTQETLKFLIKDLNDIKALKKGMTNAENHFYLNRFIREK